VLINKISIESKQISFVTYDDQAAQMTAHYHTGETRTFSSVAPDEYHKFLKAINKYDSFVKVTTPKSLYSYEGSD
jgi:hypothetical protein